MKIIITLFICVFLFGFKHATQERVPIFFSEYGFTLHSIPKVGDTLTYNKSAKEEFKIVFFDDKGKSYCERYVNKKLYEKGYYENSLDTLRRYVSGRYSNGKSSAMTVQKYFQPLKNGEWVLYKRGREIKEIYSMGTLQ